MQVRRHTITVKIRAMPTSDALRDICGRLDSGDVDYVQFLELFTRELAREMDCGRAGIWIFVGGEGGRLLHNLAMYDALQDRMVLEHRMQELRASRRGLRWLLGDDDSACPKKCRGETPGSVIPVHVLSPSFQCTIGNPGTGARK